MKKWLLSISLKKKFVKEYTKYLKSSLVDAYIDESGRLARGFHKIANGDLMQRRPQLGVSDPESHGDVALDADLNVVNVQHLTWKIIVWQNIVSTK